MQILNLRIPVYIIQFTSTLYLANRTYVYLFAYVIRYAAPFAVKSVAILHLHSPKKV